MFVISNSQKEYLKNIHRSGTLLHGCKLVVHIKGRRTRLRNIVVTYRAGILGRLFIGCFFKAGNGYIITHNEDRSMHSHDTPRRGVGIQTEESINQSGYYPSTRGRGNRFYLSKIGISFGLWTCNKYGSKAYAIPTEAHCSCLCAQNG